MEQLDKKQQGESRFEKHIKQADLTGVYRTLHLTTAEYTFLSNAHAAFSRIDHILGHKTILSEFKRIEIIQRMISDHSGMNLEIHNRRIFWKCKHMWKYVGQRKKKTQEKILNPLI